MYGDVLSVFVKLSVTWTQATSARQAEDDKFSTSSMPQPGDNPPKRRAESAPAPFYFKARRRQPASLPSTLATPLERPRGPSPTKKPPRRPALPTSLLPQPPAAPAPPTPAPHIVFFRGARPPRRPRGALPETPDDADPIDTPNFVTPVVQCEESPRRARDRSAGSAGHGKVRTVRRRISLGSADGVGAGRAGAAALRLDDGLVRLSPGYSPGRFSAEAPLPLETVRDSREDDCEGGIDGGQADGGRVSPSPGADDIDAISSFGKCQQGLVTPLCGQVPPSSASDEGEDEGLWSDAEVAETPRNDAECPIVCLPETPGVALQQRRSSLLEESPLISTTGVACAADSAPAAACEPVEDQSLSPGLFTQQPELLMESLPLKSEGEVSDAVTATMACLPEAQKDLLARCIRATLLAKSAVIRDDVTADAAVRAASASPSPSASPGLFSGQRPLTMRSCFTVPGGDTLHDEHCEDEAICEKGDISAVALCSDPLSPQPHMLPNANDTQNCDGGDEANIDGSPGNSGEGFRVASGSQNVLTDERVCSGKPFVDEHTLSAEAQGGEPTEDEDVRAPIPCEPDVVVPKGAASPRTVSSASAGSSPWPFRAATVPPPALPETEVRVATPVVRTRSPSIIDESDELQRLRVGADGSVATSFPKSSGSNSRQMGSILNQIPERQPSTPQCMKAVATESHESSPNEDAENGKAALAAVVQLSVSPSPKRAVTASVEVRAEKGVGDDSASYASTAPPPEEPSEWIRRMQAKMDPRCGEKTAECDRDSDDEDSYRPCRLLRVAFAPPAIDVCSSDSESEEEEGEDVAKRENVDSREGSEEEVEDGDGDGEHVNVPQSQVLNESDDDERSLSGSAIGSPPGLNNETNGKCGNAKGGGVDKDDCERKDGEKKSE